MHHALSTPVPTAMDVQNAWQSHLASSCCSSSPGTPAPTVVCFLSMAAGVYRVSRQHFRRCAPEKGRLPPITSTRQITALRPCKAAGFHASRDETGAHEQAAPVSALLASCCCSCSTLSLCWSRLQAPGSPHRLAGTVSAPTSHPQATKSKPAPAEDAECALTTHLQPQARMQKRRGSLQCSTRSGATIQAAVLHTPVLDHRHQIEPCTAHGEVESMLAGMQSRCGTALHIHNNTKE